MDCLAPIFHCRYLAKFILHLVERLIDEYMTKNVKINGLFYETRMTILAIILIGSEVGGININKIASLIIKVKLTPIELAYLDRKVKQFLSETTQEIDTEALIPEKYIERIAYLYIEKITLHLIKILRIISGEKVGK